MHRRSTNLIVGVVILVGLAILILGVRFLSETKFRESTYVVSVIFENVGTLTEGDPIKINGVKKGKVQIIRLKGNQVEVVMNINNEVPLTQDSKIVIQNIGLMGERMVGIQLGTGAPIEEGAILQGEFDSGIAEAMGMMGEVLEQVQVTVNDLQDIVKATVGDKDFQVRFRLIMDRLDRTTATLNQLVVQNEKALQGSIEDLSVTAGNVREFLEKNQERLDTTVGNIADITGQTKGLLDRADRITVDIEELVGRMNSDESSVGRILNDTAFVADLKATVLNADSLIRQIKKKGIKVGFW